LCKREVAMPRIGRIFAIGQPRLSVARDLRPGLRILADSIELNDLEQAIRDLNVRHLTELTLSP
jgi:hypothetical protein